MSTSGLTIPVRTEFEARIESLLLRLHKATGPDRELNKALPAAFGYFWDGRHPACWKSADGLFLDDEDFTGSLDAALALVPEGYGAVSLSISEHGQSSARLGHPYVYGNGANAALALTIAALRARAALAKAGQP